MLKHFTYRYWSDKPIRHVRKVRCCRLCRDVIDYNSRYYAASGFGAHIGCVEQLRTLGSSRFDAHGAPVKIAWEMGGK